MNKILGNKTAIAAFVAPSLILFGGIIFYSIIMSFRYSLLDWNGFGEGIFVGFSNYAKMFQDKVFLRSAVNSLLLGFVTLVTQLPLALLLALLLTSGIKGEGFYRTVFFIPMTLSSVVIGQLWLKIYNPNYGVLNTLLGVLGLESLQRSWLGDVNTALFSAFVPIIWQNVGYHMLLLYTSINSISKDILEAAKLDGASGVKAARYITIPLVKPMLRTCAIFVVIGSLKAFDMIYVLTNGGPAHMTEVPSSLMFSSIFNLNKYGYGSFIQGSQQGGGPLIDIGTHSLDLALWLMDNYDVESVTGTVFKKLGKLPQATDGNLWGAWDTSKYDVEDSAIGYIKMKSGALVVLESSWALNILEAREAEVTLCGTKAGAELRNQKEVIYNRGKYGRLTEEVLTPGEPHDFFGTRYDAPYLEAKEWLTAILEDRDPLVRPEQSLVVTQVLDAIYESAAKNETVWF